MTDTKRYVVFAGDTYYPGGGWEDYRGSYETLEEARTAEKEYLTGKGPDAWRFDWTQIVDLETGREVT